MHAYVREKNERAQKHECKMLQMQMQMNLQICQVLLQNMAVHPQHLQFLTHQQFNNVPQGSSTRASSSFNESLLQRNQCANYGM